MKALLACIVAALFPLLVATPTSAQTPVTRSVLDDSGAEPSGFWDWIHKLSGPEYKGWGLSVSCSWPCTVWNPFRRMRAPEPALLFRLSYSWYEADDDATVNPAGAELTMKAFQGTAEYLIWGPLNDVVRFEIGGALTAHLFDGAHDSFWRGSAAVYPQVRGKFWVLRPTVALGYRVFQPFGDDAFEPLNVTVDRDGLHGVWFLILKLGVRG